MDKPVELVDREAEWAFLVRQLASESPELLVVLGRRRVGKTSLLAPFARAADGLYYQATRRTAAEQLRSLSRLLGERFEDAALREGAGLPGWSELFRYLRARIGREPFCLVLDEFPYLVEAARELPSVLQSFWDHEARSSRLKIVLCGSAITALRRLEGPDQPLHARRTGRLHVHPFRAREIAPFVPGYAPKEQVEAYGIFGGLPGHLALIDPDVGVHANVVRHLLEPSSRLYDEAQHMLDAFLGEAQVHYSILDAIAAGQSTWGGITKVVGKGSGSVSRPMDWLLQMELVQRVVPITVSDATRSRRALYRLSDPYVAFWHRFVAPVGRRGGSWVAPPEEWLAARILPHLSTYLGPVFEEVCRQAVPSLAGMPFRPVEVGEWWGPGGQIDVVALGGDEEVLLGEVKWGPVDRHDVAALRGRSASFLRDLGRPARVHLALFSGDGPADADSRNAIADGRVLHFGVEDVLG